jgi:RNA polymerase sigma-70 factor (ECF subfamily)
MEPADMARTLELVRSVKTGNTRAFWDLMSIYEEMIYRFCYRKLQVKEAAEDAAKEAFVKAFEKIRTLKDDAKFKPWLFTIARNLCIDELKRGNTFVDLPEDDTPYAIPNGKANPERALEEKQKMRAEEMVMDQVGKLSEKYKDVLFLVHYEGVSYEEASHVLNVPIGTVRSRLARGLDALRSRLQCLSEMA